MSDSTPKTIGPYEVLRTLGQGGMGEVLLAYDPRLDRQVAIKRIRADITLDQNRRRRFLREARVAAALNHPAIVQVFDLLTEDESEHIVMEYVPGKSLRAIVKRGPLTLREGIRMGIDLAQGLFYAHRRGVVHRDLKTENVLVSPDGEPKITDFGIARRLLTGSPQEALTREGMVLGTYRSMSPEQIRGESVDARSDLFSFGVLLYESFTGESPFVAEAETATIARVLNLDVPPLHEVLDDVPMACSALITHLLQKDAHLRPRSAQEIAERLQNALAELPKDRGEGATALMTVVEGRPVGTAAALSGTSVSSPGTTPTTSRRRSGERRQVTLLGCEVMGLAGSSRTLDPEQLYAVMPEFRELARRVVERYEGQIESLVGHRLVAYFGYPQAHEDDAWRAVHSALEIVRQVGELQERGSEEMEAGGREGSRITARAAVHTGLAVILPDTDLRETRTSTSSSSLGELREEQVILGQTLDLTSGIQTLAEAGGVVVSDATLRLVEGYFGTEALEPTRIAGADKPVTAHRVTGELQAQSRLETGRMLSPLVARDRELGLLQDRWELARQGSGQVVLISGEGGIGKSRLVRSLHESLLGESSEWVEIRASPYTQNTPLQPMNELLRQMAGLRDVDSPQEQVTRLEVLVRRHDLPLDEAIPLLAPFLSLPLEGRYAELDLSPERRRARTLEVLLELILKSAEHQPLILAIEDLHWVDPSSLELLGVLIGQVPSVSLFMILTFRPDFEVPWGQSGPLTQLSLTRLAHRETVQLIRRVAGAKPLPKEVERQILAKTDGVPLFVEELTRTVLESGMLEETSEGWELTASLGTLDIPATLRDSLTARLDRLEEEAREAAQYAAVLGRSFTFPLLAAVAPLEEGMLAPALDRLVRAELLQRRGVTWSEARYKFRHALVQDAAYDSLLEGHRRRIHGRVVEVLEEQFPEIAEGEPELLAYHYENAGRVQDGVDAWLRAGLRAAERCAHVESGRHLRRALGLLEQLPVSEERSRKELAIRMPLGAGLIATMGYGADEVLDNATRAWELCGELGDTPLPVRYGIWAVHLTRGDREHTDEMARWFAELLSATEDPVAHLMVYNCLGVRAFYLGRFAEAEELLGQAMELFDPGQHREVAGTYGGCGGFYGHLVTTWILLLTGRLDRAEEHQKEVLALAESMDEPYTLTTAWDFEMHVAHQQRDAVRVQAAGEQVVELAKEHGFPWLQVNGECCLGWARAKLGDAAEVADSITHMRKVLMGGWRAAGVRFLFPYYSALLVEALLDQERTADGLAAIEEALAVSRTSVDPFYEPELERLHGELLLQAGSAATEVEGIFRSALDTAREQGAKLLELRLATSLARLLDREGRGGEAADLLRPVVEGFEEGHDTPDFTDATGLLGELE